MKEGGSLRLRENTCCSRNPTCFDFGVGVRACVMGGGFGAVRILFVMVRQPPNTPHPHPPCPSLPSSLSPFLHTEVYVKALRKTITLNCTSPPVQSQWGWRRRVRARACVCVHMFADLNLICCYIKSWMWAVIPRCEPCLRRYMCLFVLVCKCTKWIDFLCAGQLGSCANRMWQKSGRTRFKARRGEAGLYVLCSK